MFRRLGLVFLATLALARAAGDPAADGVAFTPKELAQGYREHVILARPRSTLRVRADTEEASEGLREREKFTRMRDLPYIDLDSTDRADLAIARLRATGRYEFVEPDYLRHI